MAIIVNGRGRVGVRVPSGAPAPSYLLDTYGGAAAAYSLRKLSSTYSGNAIRVRRSSDNTETNIGFDGSGNLDQAALTTFVGAGNGFVTTWYDQSGNGKNANQTSASNQPRIVNSGVIETLSGKPCINQTSYQGFKLQPSGWNPITSFNTLMLVNEPNVGLQTDSGAFFGNIVTVDGYWVRIVSYGLNGNAYMTNVGAGGTYTGASANKNIFYVNTRGGKLYMSFDNNVERDLGNWNASNNQVYTLFYDYQNGGKSFKGKYNELIIWSGDQSSNRSGINSNINSYYSIY
jgi:hypothetical protein